MNKKYKENFLQAGAIAKEVRSYGRSLIVKGASYFEVVEKIQHKIAQLNAKPAFPPQIALNSVAAHFLPLPNEDILFSDEVVKLDVGVCYNGAIGDCATTIDLSGKYDKLIEAAEKALAHAEASIRIGQPVREIGKIIEETIHSYGFKPIKNLSGHGLGPYRIHTAPHIPNWDDGSSAIIRPGMTFAIEPFATNGLGLIDEEGVPTIFCHTSSRPIFSEISRKLMAKIRRFEGLPFSIHDLIDQEWEAAAVWKALEPLVQAGVISQYAPLLEKAGGMVAQAENSVLVDEKGKVTITTR